MPLSRQGILLSLIGPAGSGKTTLVKKILENTEIKNKKLSISVTTRLPRESETDGIDYYFVSREEFQNKVANNQFFEWEEIHGNFYGTEKETITSALNDGVDLIFDIDIRGALNIKKQYKGNSVNIFILPPSYNEMVSRLKIRGTAKDEIIKRSKTAKKEYRLLLKNLSLIDFIIINDNIDDSLTEILEIIKSESKRSKRLNFEELKNICKVVKL